MSMRKFLSKIFEMIYRCISYYQNLTSYSTSKSFCNQAESAELPVNSTDEYHSDNDLQTSSQTSEVDEKEVEKQVKDIDSKRNRQLSSSSSEEDENDDNHNQSLPKLHKIKHQTSQYHRQRAHFYAVKRSEYFSLSHQAYHAYDHAEAKRHSSTANKFAKLMNKSNKLAADAAFVENNSKKSLRAHEIDLHGLFVAEAIERLADRIIFARQKGFSHLIVVTGRGLHSPNGPKIKPAVIRFAQDEKIVYRSGWPNAGCVRLDLITVQNNRN